MFQDENKFLVSVKDIPQQSSETANANVAGKDHKLQISSDSNVVAEVSETNNNDNKPQQTMNKIQFFLVFVNLSLAIFLTALDQTIVTTILPAIALEFNSLDEIAWVGTSYLLVETVLQPIYGGLSNIFGRKPVLLTAIFLFEIGSLLCALSINMTMLIISRAVQALGGAGFIGLVIIIISEIVPIKERGKYQGIVGGCFGIASGVGPLIGGVFTDQITWRWAFLINIPLGVITFISIIFLLHLPSPTGSFWFKFLRIDWLGAFTLVIATIFLLLPLNWAGTKYEWNDPIIIALLCLSSIGYIIFIFIEAKFAIEPIAPIYLFKDFKVISCFSINFFYGMTFYSLLFFMPIYFQVVKSESATTSGLELLPFMLSIVFMDICAGQLVSRTVFFSYGTICAFGSILMIVGSGLMSTFSENTSKEQIVVYSIIAGFGIGLIMQSSVLAGQGIVQYKDIATVTSLLSFFQSMGIVLGIAISGTVFNNIVNSNLPLQFQGFWNNMNLTEQNKLPESLKNIFVLALNTLYRIVCIFAGLSFISSLFLIKVKPHRDNNTKKILSLE
ncbi:major facilitator superfamily domain-containing protein [Gigaspora rosea]|uniref:Major facilitator superfamily domain-containing protein n=1 Tax=Gigaspora rosea TaxID=44941 RepID=A0A397UJA7_9GLOM|nr:major facilitator superfamily domain-containing protein [Gigaspora rosea]